jgi:riboflavin synthase
MFTGIIQSLGIIVSIGTGGTDTYASIDPGSGLDTGDLRPGDSISVNGVCLTVIQCREGLFQVDISAETLHCTTLGELAKGSRINLEPALKAGDALGGHMVSGHVDGVGRIVGKEDDGRSVRFLIEVSPDLARYICRKGSVCVDGVSLTVNEVDGCVFGVNIIPHTLEQTLFSGYAEGSSVNIEVDMIARYLEKLLESRA